MTSAGWDHSVFHILMAPFQYFMLAAASRSYLVNQINVDAVFARLGDLFADA